MVKSFSIEESQHFNKNNPLFHCGFCGMKFREYSFFDHVKQHYCIKPNTPYCAIEDGENTDCIMVSDSESESNQSDLDAVVDSRPHPAVAKIDLPELNVESGPDKVIVGIGQRDKDDEDRAVLIDSGSLDQNANCSDISKTFNTSKTASSTNLSDAKFCKGKLFIVPIMRFNEGMLAINPCLSTNKVVVPSKHCDFCNISFSKTEEFNFHIKSHGETFQSIREFDSSRWHSFTTTRRKNRAQFLFGCCICSFTSRIKRVIRRHIFSIHLMRESL